LGRYRGRATLPDDHELTELRKETDQRVLANLLRLNLQRAGNGHDGP